MSQAHPLERLSAADHHAVLGDDFGWPWDIGVLAIVDGTRLLDGAGRVRIDEVRQRMEPRLHLLPRSARSSTGPLGAWAGRCGSTRNHSTSPITFGSYPSRHPPVRLSCWACANNCFVSGSM
jgi:hypothetical protein